MTARNKQRITSAATMAGKGKADSKLAVKSNNGATEKAKIVERRTLLVFTYCLAQESVKKNPNTPRNKADFLKEAAGIWKSMSNSANKLVDEMGTMEM